MARRRSKKEFNPWPSFVDIFSSVILVLLFFLLFIIVLLAYYMQFTTVFSESINGKENSTIKITNEYRNGNKIKSEDEYINEHKRISIVEKKTKEKIKEIKEKIFIISFTKKDKYLTKSKYDIISSGLKYNKDFDKLIVTTYMLTDSSMSLIIKNKISLSRSINVMNYIKSKNIPLDKVIFKNKRINDNKEYKEYEKNGFVLFEFIKNKKGEINESKK
jgi:hypothetical protein